MIINQDTYKYIGANAQYFDLGYNGGFNFSSSGSTPPPPPVTVPLVLSVVDVNKTRKSIIRTVKIAINAGDYVTDGLTLDLTSVLNPNNLDLAKFTKNPLNSLVKEKYGVYDVAIIPGTSLTTWKIRLFVTGASSGAIFDQPAQSAINSGGVTPNYILVDFISSAL